MALSQQLGVWTGAFYCLASALGGALLTTGGADARSLVGSVTLWMSV